MARDGLPNVRPGLVGQAGVCTSFSKMTSSAGTVVRRGLCASVPTVYVLRRALCGVVFLNIAVRLVVPVLAAGITEARSFDFMWVPA